MERAELAGAVLVIVGLSLLVAAAAVIWGPAGALAAAGVCTVLVGLAVLLAAAARASESDDEKVAG